MADLPPMERYLSAVFVPSRSWFIVAGGPTLFVYDTKRDQDLTTSFTMSGDLSVISNPGVGLAYDPITDSLVAWGGGVVGVMNLDERVWVLRHTWQTPAADETVQGGTFGRFRYVAYLNAFILVNGPTSDVMIFKLTTGCGR